MACPCRQEVEPPGSGGAVILSQTMESDPIINRYLEERNGLIGTISEWLERDTGVKAAWLSGSTGRGEEDALSDIDLWVVLDDDRIDSVIARPRQTIAQLGNPILFLEAPQNAPEGGIYMMACYDAPVAPHIVDWYWQPLSLAFIPDQVRLIFDKAGLPQKDEPIRFPGRPTGREVDESPDHTTSFFWMMLMIAGKSVYRSPWAGEMAFLPHLVDPIAKAQRFLGLKNMLSSSNLPPHRLPGEKIRLLYRLADQMSELMAIIAGRGEEVPVSVKPGIYRYLKLIELMVGGLSDET